MKSYKLNQAVENSIFPLREDLTEIRKELKASNQTLINYFQKVIKILLSPILSIVLTTSSLTPIINAMKTSFPQCKWIGTPFMAVAVIVILLVLFSFVFWLILSIICKSVTYDEKGTPEARAQLVDFFYKCIVPEIIIAKSLLEKAEKTEASLDNKKNLEALLYYESLYRFHAVNEKFFVKNLLEYSDTVREEQEEFLDMLSEEALSLALEICIDSLKRIKEKIHDEKANEIYTDFVFIRSQLNKTKINIETSNHI